MIKITTTLILLISCTYFISCNKNDNSSQTPVTNTLYFPPAGSNEWQTVSATSLGWNNDSLNNLHNYLESKGTKAFIILDHGKIVTEQYFGSFTADSIWYWASAGKTLTAIMVGIAQQEGLINVNDLTSKYLGKGWTSAPIDKENLITIKNQLTMTSGLDDGVADPDCTLSSCMQYKADAGTRWAYHNAAYTLLSQVVADASGSSYNNYFQQKVGAATGMTGLWVQSPNSNNIFYSNARSMARFGLLLLNKGKWANTSVLSDENYFNSQINTSQNLNLSYGYLTWLNGKSSHMLPTVQSVFPGALIPNAPADLFAALGKNDQKVYVVPSLDLVVIRMGTSAGGVTESLSDFDNELWGRLKTIIHY